MHTVANTLIALGLLGVFLGGLALFVIAGQDDSRAGRLVGLIAMAASALIFAWLATGRHFL